MATTRKMRLMHVPDNILSELDKRAPIKRGNPSTSDANTTMATRYLALIKIGLREVRAVIDENEFKFLCDILNGTILDNVSIPMLWADTEDAAPEYADKWGINQEALVTKLRELSHLGTYALADAVDRYWLDGDSQIADVMDVPEIAFT